MSANRYMITLSSTRGDVKTQLKLKTVVGDKQGLIEELTKHTDWGRIVKNLKEANDEQTPTT